MQYPKKIMSIKELHDDEPYHIGYPEEYLRAIYRSKKINRDHHIAWRMDESNPKSKILFDTEALEKYRQAQCTGE